MSGRSSMDMPSLTPASTLTSKQPSLQCYDIDIDCLPSGIESFYNSNYLHSTKKRAPPPVPSTYLTTIKTHRAPKIPAPQPLNYVYSSNSSTHFNVHPLNEFRKIRAPTNNCEKPVNCKQSVNCEGLQYIDDETYCNSADNVLVDNDVESPGHQRLQFLPSTLGSRNHSSNLSIDGWSEARPASNLHSTYISCTVAKDKVPKNFLSRALSLEPGKKSKKDTYSIDANNNNNSNSKQQVLEGKERRKTIALSANPLGSIFKKMEKKVERSFSQRLGAENGIFGATKESAAANEVIKRGYETDCGVVGSQVAQTNNTNKSPSPITIRRKLSSQSKVRSRRQSKFVDQRELDERDWQSEECMDGKIEFDLPQELDMRSSLVVRQQTALRVKAIVDKLLYMSGRDQRRALFSLKAIFQNDKDLVHEFVQNGGLECLIKLGRNSDQNHQNHILRAIGQLMLYVDGMNGIIMHNETICWLYELLDSPYRLVVKTALKLLLVFVEYTESNSLLLLAAISKVEKAKNNPDWFSLMRILNEQNASDDETLVFGMTVINKTLNGVPDQDTFFDVIDVLENQGLEDALKAMLKLNNTQLTQQCNHYEQELRKEDAALESDSYNSNNELVKMRINGNLLTNGSSTMDRRCTNRRRQAEAEELRTSQPAALNNKILVNKFEHQVQKHNGVPEPPAWRKVNGISREEEEEISEGLKKNLHIGGKGLSLTSTKKLSNGSLSYEEEEQPSPKVNGKLGGFADEKENIEQEKEDEEVELHQMKAPPPCIPTNIFSPTEKKTYDFPEPLQQAPEFVVEAPKSRKPDSDDEELGGAGGFAALLQKRAKKMEGSAFRKGLIDTVNRQSESEVKWKEAAEKLKEKPMIINDLDFSGFVEYEQDPLVLVKVAQVAQEKGLLPAGGSMPSSSGVPPAPPPIPGGGGVPPPPPAFGRARETSPGPSSKAGGTLKLHWKPAQSEAPPVPALKRKGTFWNKVETTPQIDTSKLSRLFEQKAKEAPVKKAGGEAKPQVLQVLSVKRSQAINIGLTKLPPISVIPTAIRKFDASVLNKEGIEKILSTMMPSCEEVERIQERQADHPDTPLGQAEQFMLSLSEIDCLLERLRLWLFMLDYQNLEKDVAESLMELNNAMKEIEESKTFRVAMGMLLTIGNALNGSEIKAFQLDYLSRASEVKDPVHKYPLTHHLAEYMLDNYPEGTDLYTEFGAVSRSSRIDFEAVLDNLKKMEVDCKACFDYVARISQKDNNSSMKNKVNSFLAEVAERIHRLKHVHRTTQHRWSAFLLYFGYSPAEVKDQKPLTVFKMVIEFSLEYRTNRDKILQMRKRMAEKRERNKTRGMMIGAAAQAQTSGQPAGTNSLARAGSKAKHAGMTDRERHQEMSRLLTGGTSTTEDNTLNRRRAGPTPERSLIAAQTEAMRKSPGEGESPDDELLDGVVRTVTATADSRDQNRRRARLFNRKSLRRTRTIRQDQLIDLNNMNNY